jgi:hypothetical protein
MKIYIVKFVVESHGHKNIKAFCSMYDAEVFAKQYKNKLLKDKKASSNDECDVYTPFEEALEIEEIDLISNLD